MGNDPSKIIRTSNNLISNRHAQPNRPHPRRNIPSHTQAPGGLQLTFGSKHRIRDPKVSLRPLHRAHRRWALASSCSVSGNTAPACFAEHEPHADAFRRGGHACGARGILKYRRSWPVFLGLFRDGWHCRERRAGEVVLGCWRKNRLPMATVLTAQTTMTRAVVLVHIVDVSPPLSPPYSFHQA